MAMSVGKQISLVKGSDPCTFGSGCNHSGDSACARTAIEVQCRKCTDKRADVLTLPSLVLPGEYGGDIGERRVSYT